MLAFNALTGAVFAAILMVSTEAFTSTSHGRTIKSVSSPQQLSMKMDWDSVKSAIKPKLIPALLGSAFLFGNPMDSHALSSGSRRGGSSFGGGRSSTRQYAAPRSSYQTRSYNSRPTINVMPAPMFSPFGFSPFGFSPFGYGFGGFMPINLNVIILAGVAYAIYNVLQNRAGGADWSGLDDEDVGSLGAGASVVKLSLALDADWNERNNIMESLARIAEKNNAMTSRRDLASLLSETSLALLRQNSKWTASAFATESFGRGNARQAEPLFQQIAIRERAKFEEEKAPSSSVAMINEAPTDGPKKTQAVVSIVVALRGRDGNAARVRDVRSYTDAIRCLEGLAADALTDDGENVMALEILWTPSDPTQTLTPRDLIADYPELTQL